MTTSTIAAETFVRNPTTATAEVEGQLVALDVQAGVCFGLNEVATHIWKLLDGATDTNAICEALQQTYDVDPVTCEEETLSLLRELVDAGLVSRA